MPGESGRFGGNIGVHDPAMCGLEVNHIALKHAYGVHDTVLLGTVFGTHISNPADDFSKLANTDLKDAIDESIRADTRISSSLGTINVT